jgi:drug/metabolite transporter (DMT)-like permease
MLVPGIAAGLSLGVADVVSKLVLASGSDVLTLLSFRSLFGLAFVASWLRFGTRPQPATPRVRGISVVIGLLFAALIYCLYRAVAIIDVPTAVLTYFTYPLLTGLAAAAIGLERLHWRGVVCAFAAFCGLAVMIGAHPAGLVYAGVAFGLAASGLRTLSLLVTRRYLVGADARLTTWYSLLTTALALVVLLFSTQSLHPPQSTTGWTALIIVSLSSTAAILFVFVSTMRIGAFRTALVMNLEPLTVLVLSAVLLGEVITPLQGVGSAIMLLALVAFQLWR